MTVGLVVTAIPLLGNQATVLFTFYPPLKAHLAFYFGLMLADRADGRGGGGVRCQAPRLDRRAAQ
jgi:hypothetical protein